MATASILLESGNTPKKTSQLTAAGALAGTEEVALVQSGATKRTTAQDIANLGGGGGLTTATIDLASSDILTLHTIPVTLVAAPGSGSVISVISAFIDYKYVTTAYTGGGGVEIDYDGNSTGDIALIGDAFFTQASSQFANPVCGTAGPKGRTAADDKPVMLIDTVADYAAGDGTCRVTVTYRTITLS